MKTYENLQQTSITFSFADEKNEVALKKECVSDNLKKLNKFK